MVCPRFRNLGIVLVLVLGASLCSAAIVLQLFCSGRSDCWNIRFLEDEDDDSLSAIAPMVAKIARKARWRRRKHEEDSSASGYRFMARRGFRPASPLRGKSDELRGRSWGYPIGYRLLEIGYSPSRVIRAR
jgi:hypothetical protein